MRYALLLTLFMLGCASKTSAVHPTDDGRYTVTAQTESQASNGVAIARHKAFKIADRFCATKDRAADMQTFDDSTTATSYVSTLVFTCR
jgi:hypothetical protein